MAGKKAAEKEFNVDEALDRLEEINKKLSEKGIALNESLELYKEGTVLAAKCQEHLEGVEKTLQIING
ncbi:MAG: exodeoxyribonuclease VII small subunit [Lachnospiraceae bacterium]|nr:exodeoxyribonuclease VII small subunit [Lachnospiraceae bacterium]